MRSAPLPAPPTAHPHKTPETPVSELGRVPFMWDDPRVSSLILLDASQVKESGGCKACDVHVGFEWLCWVLAKTCGEKTGFLELEFIYGLVRNEAVRFAPRPPCGPACAPLTHSPTPPLICLQEGRAMEKLHELKRGWAAPRARHVSLGSS